MKVLHVISDLGRGGAETVLFRLVSASRDDITHCVISMRGLSHHGPRLRAQGVAVHALEMPRGHVTLSGMLRLRRLITREAPDVVQTWMYHGDLLGGLVARWAGVRAVAWGVRHAALAPSRSRLATRLVARACATLSSMVPTVIVCCSRQAAAWHQSIGYRAERFVLISNGYDLSRFMIDPEARRQRRAAFGIDEKTPLLGMVARWNPDKDHANLFGALARLRGQGRQFHCVLVGDGMSQDNAELIGQLVHFDLNRQVILVGATASDDMPAWMNALDLHVLSSAGEAFPNVVAEAMACGTPCVVTDVGDAAWIVGETGWVVPPGDPEALAGSIDTALDALSIRGRDAFSAACRHRIAREFSLDRMVAAYASLWREIGQDAARRGLV